MCAFLIHIITQRDLLTKKINEQENLNKTLKDKQKTTATVHVDGKKQMKLWRDLLRQFELKRKLNSVNDNSDLKDSLAYQEEYEYSYIRHFL